MIMMLVVVEAFSVGTAAKMAEMIASSHWISEWTLSAVHRELYVVRVITRLIAVDLERSAGMDSVVQSGSRFKDMEEANRY